AVALDRVTCNGGCRDGSRTRLLPEHRRGAGAYQATYNAARRQGQRALTPPRGRDATASRRPRRRCLRDGACRTVCAMQLDPPLPGYSRQARPFTSRAYPLTGSARRVHRLAVARRSHREGVRPSHILAALLLAMVVAAGTGLVVAATAVSSVITALSEDLPDPASLLTLRYPQPTIIYDRTGKIELGR